MDSAKFVVSPWEVSGEVDYKRLIEQFGVEPIDEELIRLVNEAFKEDLPEIKRGIAFSHRDFNKVLLDFLKGEKLYLYTGRGPSGYMHIGHIIPFIFTKRLLYIFDTFVLIQFTSDEKYMYHHKLSPKDVYEYTYDNIKDVLALGFPEDKTVIIEDYRHIKYLYPLATSFSKRVTLSTVKAIFGFTDSSNIGLAFFPSIQAAPAFLGYVISEEVRNCLIPAAIDQDPYWRLTRDIAVKIGFPKPAQIHLKLLPGLKRGVKMSSSLPETAVFLTDTEELVNNKIMNAFTGGQPTVELQRKLGGNPDICVVFEYYRFLFEDDDDKLNERYANCRTGALMCGECKAELADRINSFLKKHREKKEKIDKDAIEKCMLDNKVDLEDYVRRFKLLR